MTAEGLPILPGRGPTLPLVPTSFTSSVSDYGNATKPILRPHCFKTLACPQRTQRTACGLYAGKSSAVPSAK